MSIKCLIIDDEEMSRLILTSLIEKTDELDLIKQFEDPTEAVAFLKNNNIDVIFLDIEMPHLSGLEFIALLKNQSPQIIFTTSHSEFAIEAFQFNVSGYLVKPITFEAFYKAIEKVKLSFHSKKTFSNNNENLFIKADHTVYNISLIDINWIECMGDYLSIHTDTKKYVIHSTMKHIMGRLPEKDFLRVHRSFIIRINRIESVEDDTVSYKEKIIPIGKSHRSEVYKRLNIL